MLKKGRVIHDDLKRVIQRTLLQERRRKARGGAREEA